MKQLNRREALSSLSAAASGLLFSGASAIAAPGEPRRTQLGIVTYAFGIHQKHDWAGRHHGLAPAWALMEEAHQLKTAGIQVDFPDADALVLGHSQELRSRAESYQMYIEASISPPKSAEDVARFDRCVVAAQAAGASLARTVISSGRRYEDLTSVEQFHEADQRGIRSLELAEPVLAKRNFRLAVENHKDHRIGERLSLLKRLGSERIGLCVDVGNSFTLMEDPLDTVRAYAPYAFTSHFKDQAVRENAEGFWYADVPLGAGFLDLPQIIQVLRAAKPDIHLNLELITRDALAVPCLKR